MSQAAGTEYETDEEREAREEQERANNREGFDRRQRDKDKRDSELADLRAFKAEAERKEALDQARKDLNASGPVNAFLRTYKGDPTADAIRKAIAADDDFADLITFEPDPRDTAAAAQASMAAKNKGGDPIGAKVPVADTAPGAPRLEAAYAAKAPKQT